jgi:hypothetical protein
VYFTVQGLGLNRIARFTFNFNTRSSDPTSHFILPDLEPMVAAIHAGDALNFREAVAELRWSGPDILKQLIPRNAFFAAGAPLPVRFVEFSVRPNGDTLSCNGGWKTKEMLKIIQ